MSLNSSLWLTIHCRNRPLYGDPDQLGLVESLHSGLSCRVIWIGTVFIDMELLLFFLNNMVVAVRVLAGE